MKIEIHILKVMFSVYIEYSWYDLKMFSLCVCCGNSLLIKFFCGQNIFGWVVHHCFPCLCSLQTSCVHFKYLGVTCHHQASFRIMWDLFLQNQSDHMRTVFSVTSVFLHCLWLMLKYNEYHGREWEESDTCHLTILNLLNRILKAQSGFTIYSLFLGVTISNTSILQGCVTRWQRAGACGQWLP